MFWHVHPVGCRGREIDAGVNETVLLTDTDCRANCESNPENKRLSNNSPFMRNDCVINSSVPQQNLPVFDRQNGANFEDCPILISLCI